MEKALNQEGCRNFLSKYVNSDNLLNVFDKVRVQGGIAFGATEWGAYNVGKVNDYYGAAMTINDKRNWNFQDAKASFEITYSLINTLIHELIHASTFGGNDFQMQNKVKDAGESTPFGYQTDPKQVAFASINWGSVLGDPKYCGYSRETFLQWWHGN